MVDRLQRPGVEPLKNPIIVQKYGGTTLKDPGLLRNCGENICREYHKGKRPVIVVSAMGRADDPYATDTFLNLAYAISATPALRELDLLMACGELVSATLLAVQIQELGCPAMALTGSQLGIITDRNHGNAEIEDVEVKRIHQVLEAGIIPVICGFQGVTIDGELTTLGRGGSDITAVAVAAALDLSSATIYTDVPAIKTADPKIVASALPIYHLNYQEILEMAIEGARVIHPRAVERARVDGIRLLVTSLANDGIPPTEIGPEPSCAKINNGIRAITYISSLNQYRFQLLPREMAIILDEIAVAGISLDNVNLAETGQDFTISQADVDLAEKIFLDKGTAVKKRDKCSKITLIGTGFRDTSGLMNRIYRPLASNSIPIYHSTDSPTQVSLLVPGEKLADALNLLHKVFFDKEEST